MGGCAQLQAMVHGVTTEECQAALRSHSWSIQRAAQYLKVPPLPACPAIRGLKTGSAVPDPILWLWTLCPIYSNTLGSSVSHGNITLCPSGGAALWAGSSATGGVPQSARDVRLEPRASRLSPSGVLWPCPPQVSKLHTVAHLPLPGELSPLWETPTYL